MTTTRKSSGVRSAARVCSGVIVVVSLLAAGCATLRSKPWDDPIKTVEWEVLWPASQVVRGVLDEEIRKLDGVIEAKMTLISAFDSSKSPKPPQGGPNLYRLKVRYDSRKLTPYDLASAISQQGGIVDEYNEARAIWGRYSKKPPPKGLR